MVSCRSAKAVATIRHGLVELHAIEPSQDAVPLTAVRSDNNSFRSNPSQQGIFENSTSEISFTSNSDSSTVSPRRYKNFDIHLAQIDIETFRSEDIERISHNSFNLPMEDSTDTLRYELVCKTTTAVCSF